MKMWWTPARWAARWKCRGVLPLDTMVTPNRDSTGCLSFHDVTLPRERGARTPIADTATTAIGNAVVWLVGVTHGPRMEMPRRVSMVLDGCHFEPRVLVAPVGATLITSNRDDMVAISAALVISALQACRRANPSGFPIRDNSCRQARP